MPPTVGRHGAFGRSRGRRLARRLQGFRGQAHELSLLGRAADQAGSRRPAFARDQYACRPLQHGFARDRALPWLRRSRSDGGRSRLPLRPAGGQLCRYGHGAGRRSARPAEGRRGGLCRQPPCALPSLELAPGRPHRFAPGNPAGGPDGAVQRCRRRRGGRGAPRRNSSSANAARSAASRRWIGSGPNRSFRPEATFAAPWLAVAKPGGDAPAAYAALPEAAAFPAGRGERRLDHRPRDHQVEMAAAAVLEDGDLVGRAAAGDSV